MSHGSQELRYTEIASGLVSECSVAWALQDDHYKVELVSSGLGNLQHTSPIDFEECLLDLRDALEQRGVLLHCARFAKNAFVSPMSQQSSKGLSCYRVKYGRPVHSGQLVDSFSPAEAESVATARENAEFIKRWIWTCRLTSPLHLVRPSR